MPSQPDCLTRRNTKSFCRSDIQASLSHPDFAVNTGSIPVNWSESRIVVGSGPSTGINSEFTIDELAIRSPDEKSIASRARISLPLIK